MSVSNFLLTKVRKQTHINRLPHISKKCIILIMRCKLNIISSLLLIGFAYLSESVVADSVYSKSHQKAIRDWVREGFNDKVLDLISSLSNDYENDALDLITKTDIWKKTIFHTAAENRNADFINKIVESHLLSKPEISNILSQKDYRGRTALHLSAQTGCIDCMRNILENINNSQKILKTTDNFGKNVLHFAAETGQFQVVRFLSKVFERKILDVNSEVEDSNGKTALIIAAENGHLEFVNAIIAFSDVDIQIKDLKTGETALMKAIKIGHLPIVQTLIRKDPSCLYQKDANGKNVLHFAVISGQSGILEVLINSIEFQDLKLKQKLARNTKKQWSPVLNEMILAQDVTDGSNLLHLASKFGHQNICQDLIKYPRLLYQLDNSGQSVIHTAVSKNNASNSNKNLGKYVCLDLILNQHTKILYKGGFDGVITDLINVKDKSGFPAVFRAIEYGDSTILMRLLKSDQINIKTTVNIDINKNKQIGKKLNLLHYAVYQNEVELIGFLVKTDATFLSEKMTDGSTPLILAVKLNNFNAVSKLLHYSNEKLVNMVDRKLVGVKNKKNRQAKTRKISRTALIWAVASNNFEISNLLIGSHADVNFLADDSKSSALHFASAHGNDMIVRKLIDSDADISVIDETGRDPLYTALSYGQTDVVEILVDAFQKLYSNDNMALLNIMISAYDFAQSQNNCDMTCLEVFQNWIEEMEDQDIFDPNQLSWFTTQSTSTTSWFSAETTRLEVAREGLVNPFQELDEDDESDGNFLNLIFG